MCSVLGFGLLAQRKQSRVTSEICGGELHQRLGEIIDELVASGVSLEQARGEFERQYLVRTLRVASGGVSRSAEMLGVHRNTLRNKVSAMAIRPSEYAKPPSR